MYWISIKQSDTKYLEICIHGFVFISSVTNIHMHITITNFLIIILYSLIKFQNVFNNAHSIFTECAFEYRDEFHEHNYQIPVKIAKRQKRQRIASRNRCIQTIACYSQTREFIVQPRSIPYDIPIYGKTCRVRNVLYRRRSFRLLTFYVFKSVPQSLPGEKRDFCRVHGASRIFIKIALEHEYVHTLRDDRNITKRKRDKKKTGRVGEG